MVQAIKQTTAINSIGYLLLGFDYKTNITVLSIKINREKYGKEKLILGVESSGLPVCLKEALLNIPDRQVLNREFSYNWKLI